MKINKKMLKKIFINVSVTLLILGVLGILGGFLWLNQKPNFSKYHSGAIGRYNGDNLPLTDEQFQRIIEVYKNSNLEYMALSDCVCGGYDIYLYKTKDMSGQYDILCTGNLQENFIMIYSDTGCKSFMYEPYTFRQVEAVIEEAINEAKGE